jgi:hypothetical protein
LDGYDWCDWNDWSWDGEPEEPLTLVCGEGGPGEMGRARRPVGRRRGYAVFPAEESRSEFGLLLGAAPVFIQSRSRGDRGELLIFRLRLKFSQSASGLVGVVAAFGDGDVDALSMFLVSQAGSVCTTMAGVGVDIAWPRRHCRRRLGSRDAESSRVCVCVCVGLCVGAEDPSVSVSGRRTEWWMWMM